ncbi:MAG: hypothetical protein ACRYHQ_32020 [Janthinobacterium lividum]
MIAWIEVTLQAAWQRLARHSLVRAMWWKARVDRRRARPVAAGTVMPDRRRAVR